MLSIPSAIIPAKKHHVAGEGFLRTTLTPASSRLKIPATNGSWKKSVHRSWRLNHTNNKNSGIKDNAKKTGPPWRWMRLSIMCGPICTQSRPMTRIRKLLRTIASGITKATRMSRRHGLSRKRCEATRLVMNSTQLE